MSTDGQTAETTLVGELRAGRSVTYFTRGVSMRPLLRTAETHVHILPIAGAEDYLERGIVLYVRHNGQLVLHRLIRQKGDIFYMRGDNTYGLEPIRREQLVGVVDLIWKDGAYIDVRNDRRYRRYVRRRIADYPVRWLVHNVDIRLRALARRILRRTR